MNFTPLQRLLLALLSGVALGLSFPTLEITYMAWAAIALLMLSALGARPGIAALCGFLHGLAFYPTCLTWIATVMHQYGDIDPVTSAGIVGLIGVAGGIILSVFTLAVAAVGRKSLALACCLAPFLWVTLEFFRTHLPYIGFPWNLTGYAATNEFVLLQLACWTGIFGLSFVLAAYNSFLVYCFLRRELVPRMALVGGTVVLLLLAWDGSALVPFPEPHHIAHLVQTDFPQSEHYPADWMDIHAGEMNELERISVDAARRSPGLIVWPEVPAPFSLQDPKFAHIARDIAAESGSDFLVGIVDWKHGPGGVWEATNSATLLNAAGQRIFTYDKIHLVPFGEYVPLRRWIKFAGRLTADIADFTPGTEYRVGNLRGGKFGVFICYEAIFPSEVRHFEENGADLLINISNDGWFGRSSAPEQHLMMSQVRAVENRRWLLRDTNNGFTVAVDPYGRIIDRLPTDIRGVLDAPYDFRTDRTLYARWGDWFAWLCVAMSGLLAAVGFRKRVPAVS
jgi:apolipoprotein N-acyltransferase